MASRSVRPLLRVSGLFRSIPTSRIVPAFRVIALAPATRTFTSSFRFLGSGTSDGTLSAALAAEHTYELEAAKEGPATPEFLERFVDEKVWEVQDLAGVDNVALIRTFGNETLKITFQVSDLDDPSAQEQVDENGVMIDPPTEDVSATPFITCALLITKSATPGAMSIDLEAGEEGFEVTNVAMFEKAQGEMKGAEGDWARRSRYMGPQFEHLDSSVQEAFQAYLAERGVTEELAQFVLQYCEYKEQKDYMSWLQDAKGFVEA
ncbi:MAG: Mitochondrial acidic protein mam33 [Tremellales sp. Tagirdzhanova-0007]|nr:MAG: Mitochondrial acidic protein mam33 [Tremellales sp. Tagirdzhanova-0007]